MKNKTRNNMLAGSLAAGLMAGALTFFSVNSLPKHIGQSRETVKSCSISSIKLPIKLSHYQINGPRGMYHAASYDINEDGFIDKREYSCARDFARRELISENCGIMGDNE
jgi:hypothetical protein